jgi:hypothetical protein
MVVVVHPNIVDPAKGDGLQIGTTMIVTEGGSEVIHDFRVELVQA